MSAPTVSVVIVSHGRPDHLSLCLRAVACLYYHPFEVVVVADAPGRDRLQDEGWGGRCRLVSCETANIALARNLGISASGGEIVAFLDDDAVPEPSWLDHLAGAFAGGVAAAGGYVRGRNGISFQWRARQVRPDGSCVSLPFDGTAPRRIPPPPDGAIKTEGTNMAVRREVLVALGGFDPAFRFYLDETDLNMRLARGGHATVLVPLAQVHHRSAPSARRRADRAPLSLHDIGASSAVFWRKHPMPAPAAARRRLRAEQRARLLRLLVDGACEPRDVSRLEATLEAGLTEGGKRRFGEPAAIADPPPFRPFNRTAPQRAASLHGGASWHRARLHRAATEAAGRGEVATVLRFSPTTLFHRQRFTRAGYWLQTGGWFGRSDRAGPLLHFTTCSRRIAAEWAAVAPVRAPSADCSD